MEAFDGSVLFVSHDRYFINRFATRIWELADGTITDYPMGFTQYQAVKAQEQQERTPAPVREKRGDTRPAKGNRSQQAARLCYETKKAMKELCPWETWVHLYYLGYIQSSLPSVFIDGVEHKPSEFIDNVCADYGGAARPVNGMGLSGCAGNSIQLNYGYSISSSGAKALMNQGYGWIMWFAFDPSGTGTVSNNRSHSLKQFRNVAQGCYEQNVLDPKNVYNKIGEGQYDPAPHPIN